MAKTSKPLKEELSSTSNGVSLKLVSNAIQSTFHSVGALETLFNMIPQPSKEQIKLMKTILTIDAECQALHKKHE